MKINLLDKSVYNKISAGEVVERPASVVKELVENAIDAGATYVEILVFGGGVKKIVVADNGIGIEKSEVKKAFLPHATSKLFSADDLLTISTLGFRGEALASIASVSKVKIETRVQNSDHATVLILDGGDVKEETVGSRDKGTCIEISDLFFNTPARLKFLKSERAEQGAITTLVSKLILANPTVAFLYRTDDKTVYLTDGSGLKNAVYTVLDKETVKNLVPIYAESGGYKISGYVSLPTYTKPNRTYQTAIINGRFVESDIFRTAVEKAYSPYLMKRSYPAYILDFLLPFDNVDVNVHPAKTEVRFSDSGHIFGFVYKYVASCLSDAYKLTEFSTDNTNSDEFSARTTKNSGNFNGVAGKIGVDGKGKVDQDDNRGIDSSNEKSSVQKGVETQTKAPKTFIPTSIFDTLRTHNTSPLRDGGMSYTYKTSDQNPHQNQNSHILENSDKLPETFDFEGESTLFDQETAISSSQTKTTQAEAVKSENHKVVSPFMGKIVGQIFSTYIIVEYGENAYIIDQHAAEERIIYDRLQASIKEGIAQPMLVPYVAEFNHAEYEQISYFFNDLTELGFEIEEFGERTIKISAVPQALTEMNFSEFFKVLFESAASYRSPKLKDLLQERLSQAACKAAIKGGASLNQEQIAMLLSAFDSSGNPPLTCPHGRPAVIKMSKREFEKMFKRTL